MTQEILQQDFISHIDDMFDVPEDSFILRVTEDTTQTGIYRGMTEDNCLLLSNVIDLPANLYFASDGVLKPERSGSLYLFESNYEDDMFSDEALAVVRNWVLFQKTPRLQHDILDFVQNTFAPKFILFLKRTEQLKQLFVPIQQYFRIGRYVDKSRWEDINALQFRKKLDKLLNEEHITYVGHLPEAVTDKPVFFTVGNYSHLETDQIFRDQPCLYRSNCGGNIKLVKEEEDARRKFMVDAGASYKGNGVNARAEEASVIAQYLKKIYPDYSFVPTSGRGAIGSRHNF